MARRVAVAITGDSVSLQRAFASSANAARMFGSEMQAVTVKTTASAEAQVRASVATREALVKQVAAYRAVARAATEGSREQIAAANLAARAQARLARSTAVTAGERAALVGGSGAGARSVGLGGVAARGIGGMRAAFTGLTGFGPGVVGVAGLGLALGKTISVAAGFQRTMNILRSVSGATAAQFHRLSAEALKLGNDTKLPATSAGDAAEAMTELSKAGLSVKDTMSAARGVLQMSAAAGISNSDAAAIAARNLNAFGLEGKQATHIADLLAASANATSGEMTDMADALSYTAATSAQAHVSIEDTVASIGQMANKGIVGGQAGAALQQMLLKLESPTKKARSAMDELGISIYDQHGKMLPLRNIIGQFTEKTKGMSDSQRNAAMNAMFGSRAIRAANIVLLGGVAAHDKMRAAVNKQGAAARIAAAINKGAAGAWDGFKSAAETLAISIGTLLLPAIEKYTRKLAKWLGDSRHQKQIIDGVRTAIHLISVAFKVWRITMTPTIEGLKLVVKTAMAIKHAWPGIKEATMSFFRWIEGAALRTALKIVEPFSHLPSKMGQWARDAKEAMQAQLANVNSYDARQAAKATAEESADMLSLHGKHASTKRKGGGGGGGAAASVAAAVATGDGTAATRANVLSLALAKAGLTKSFADDLAALDDQRALIRTQIGRLEAKKTLTDKETEKLTALYGDLAGVGEQIGGIRQGQAQAARERRAKAAARAAAKRNALQFGLLGLDASGGERTPGIQGLKRQLGSVENAVKGTFLDTEKQRSVLSRLRKLLSGQLGALSKEVRGKIKEMLDGIKGQLGEKGQGIDTYFAVSTRKLVAGLNMSAADRTRLRERLAQQAGHQGRTPALGAAGVMGQTVNLYGAQFHGVNDVHKLHAELSKAGRTKSQRRGVRR